MAEHRLTLNDQFVVNALIYLVSTVTPEPGEERMVLECLAGVLPRCLGEAPNMGPVLAAAECYVAATRAGPGERREAMFRAHIVAKAAIKPFALWRMGLIQDALRQRQGAQADA